MDEDNNTDPQPKRAARDPQAPPPLLGPDPEFEDEAPGAYIRELGVGSWNAIWAATNLIVGGGVALWNYADTSGTAWQPLRHLLWTLLPISALAVFIITLWQSGSRYTGPAPRRTLMTIALCVAAFVLWLVMNSHFA